jgi:hypothetical protein
MRRVALVLVLAGWLSMPGVARASPAGDALRHGDVFAAPGSPASAADASRLEQAAASLRRSGSPTKFAVLAARPAEGSPAAARALRGEIGFNGTLLVLAPGTLGVASSRVSQGAILSAYNAALPTLRADLIGGAIAVARQLATTPASGSGGGGGGAVGTVVAVLVVLAVTGAIVLLGARSRRRKAARMLEDRRAALEPLVDGLATQITEIGPEVEAAGAAADAARPDYEAALTAYGEARDALPRAADEGAVKLAALKLEAGLRAAARARAALDGKPPPAPDAPLLEGLCTFDPKHGRAITTAAVSGPSGRLEEVPVCAECRDRLAGGVTPDVRTVAVGGRPVPYFTGMPPLGGGTGLGPLIGAGVGGFLLAELLDSGPAYGYGYGSGGGFGWEDRDRFEGDDASGGGDFDWGGGSDDDSFGGGDFDSGGGDFGGGDSGGDF